MAEQDDLFDLNRFVKAQASDYARALAEIRQVLRSWRQFSQCSAFV